VIKQVNSPKQLQQPKQLPMRARDLPRNQLPSLCTTCPTLPSNAPDPCTKQSYPTSNWSVCTARESRHPPLLSAGLLGPLERVYHQSVCSGHTGANTCQSSRAANLSVLKICCAPNAKPRVFAPAAPPEQGKMQGSRPSAPPLHPSSSSFQPEAVPLPPRIAANAISYVFLKNPPQHYVTCTPSLLMQCIKNP
jgi:hypothetical protein